MVGDSCLQVSVAGAEKILNELPEMVWEVFYARDCECGSGSDDCCGKAVDMMWSGGEDVRSLLPSAGFPSFRGYA